MTFRDDHDAALARAEALERQLAEARAKADETAAEALEAQAEKARLEDELADLRDVQHQRTADRVATRRPAPPPGTLPETVEAAPPDPFGAGRIGLVIALLVAVVLLAMYVAP